MKDIIQFTQNYFNCCVKNVLYRVKHGSWEVSAMPKANSTNCFCFMRIAIKIPPLPCTSYHTYGEKNLSICC